MPISGYILVAALAYFGLGLLMWKAAGMRTPKVKKALAARRRRAQMRYIKGGKWDC